MSDVYPWLKALHIVSAAVLFGTGLGTAFQMWTAHRSGNVRAIAVVAKHVVWADFLFTMPAIIVQPATGVALMWLAGYAPDAPWLFTSYALYVLAGVCWLPVVWIQLKVYVLAREVATEALPLPATYFRLMRLWFWLGWPAFAAVLLIFWLMVAKPVLW